MFFFFTENTKNNEELVINSLRSIFYIILLFVYVSIGTGVLVCACVFWCPYSCADFKECSMFLFEAGSLWPGAHQLSQASLLVSSRDPMDSPSTGSTSMWHLAKLVPECWRVTSGSCMASILPTESLPQPILCNSEVVYNKPVSSTLTLSARLLKSPIRLMVLRMGSVESSIMLWVVTGGKDCLCGHRGRKCRWWEGLRCVTHFCKRPRTSRAPSDYSAL